MSPKMNCKIAFLFICESAPLIDLRLYACSNSIERGRNRVESCRHMGDTFRVIAVFSAKECPSGQIGRKTALPGKDAHTKSEE